ncbi:hypothetical protein C1J05_13930 [Sulfitobacter sp. JL08]|uniref:DUF2924 domain-containing protein n=1 Tax=Sulfitobacter sp. JL08 TaxID=2070369 RepID=UPI000E0BC66C|nr:hypothetical protein C1J05_13930 [Sulfitobacter sp. JL08]
MSSREASIRLQWLEEANAATLRQFWAETRGSEPPRTLTARLMRLALAWDVQVALSGGETAGTRRAWNRAIRARTYSRSPKNPNGAVPRMIGEGTRILKDWGGTTHEVQITENGGVTWNGQSYSSLSAVARGMTGTNRNGPRFFGLREGGKR